ncbi:unnamed protein product [Ostreobium quekettii]|uniref:Uncharacterized protein n=1 Tax=Ostreobium quekettii TaxID=121088 RepID=A0A8S1J191_9CHLO|nr:unnamed protein product [Ostreobium quekettii]|eukprot:evm.model.scf_683EXC.4 EVM.evm.TU.scf_683EXC.4   scf_683EXC:55219-57999(-)
MHRGKRPASQNPELLQKQEDFELSGVAAAASKKWAKSVSKLQRKAEMEDSNGDDAWLSTLLPEAYDLPVPGVRAPKSKPHHRRTASRVLDELPMVNPLFETVDQPDRGVSCPRLGTKNWFAENGVDIPVAESRAVPEAPKGPQDTVTLERTAVESREARRGGGDRGRSAGGHERSSRGGAPHRRAKQEKRPRIFPANGVVEGGRGPYAVALRGPQPKVAPAFPWRMLFYVTTLLAWSLAVEIVTDYGQKAMACGACVVENRELANRIEATELEMFDRVGSMGMLLSTQALENHRLKEELVDAQLFAKYVRLGGRLNVKENQGAKASGEEMGSPPASPLARFLADVQKGAWRLRYHFARLVGYIRKHMNLPIDSAMYERLKWLESMAVGPVE